jgi:hypothetical protein
MSGMLGFLFIGGALGALVSIVAFAFWLWMLISAVTNNGIAGGEKVAWVLVVIFVPCIGPVIYFFIGHPKRT